jgi:hypothetical protein
MESAERLIHPLDGGARPAELTLTGVLAGAGVRFLEPADACEAPNTKSSPRAFEIALLKAPEGVGGAGVLHLASPGAPWRLSSVISLLTP